MNYNSFSVGTKVQSYDSFGYYIMPLCGTIEKHLGGGHVIIKSFDGSYYSTVGRKVAEIEALSCS